MVFPNGVLWESVHVFLWIPFWLYPVSNLSGKPLYWAETFQLKLLFIYWTAVSRCCGFSCTRASVKSLFIACKGDAWIQCFPISHTLLQLKMGGTSEFESVYWTFIWMKTYCALLMAERAHFLDSAAFTFLHLFHCSPLKCPHSVLNRSWECDASHIEMWEGISICPPCSYPHFSFFFSLSDALLLSVPIIKPHCFPTSCLNVQNLLYNATFCLLFRSIA